MELTSKHLEEIRKAARTVEYGSVTINISASARTLDLTIEHRIKLEKEPETSKAVRRAETPLGARDRRGAERSRSVAAGGCLSGGNGAKRNPG
ncbi:MAG: hypothetical protein LBK05_09080 [Treponema sp.]|jgi:hypothetical protein|nr:hypothetical protein [Treponema sp.]